MDFKKQALETLKELQAVEEQQRREFAAMSPQQQERHKKMWRELYGEEWDPGRITKSFREMFPEEFN